MREKRLVHGWVGHQAVGVELERGEQHVLRVVVQHLAEICRVGVQLDVGQERTAARQSQEPGARLGVAAGFEGAGAHTLFEIALGVVDHALPQRLRQFAAGLQRLHQIGGHGCEGFDLGELREPCARAGVLHRLGLGDPDRFDDVGVAGFAQFLLGAEVVDHQCRADAGGRGDAANARREPVLAELLDRRVTDAGDGGEVLD
ncbi:hypothetical protein MMUC44124_04190 [Mycolicibacterium mucogenicum DSM 44124]|nr:hypothetical protein MMUC44124_04190 [Mycolicibacterium mucogenicum DSM 44124]